MSDNGNGSGGNGSWNLAHDISCSQLERINRLEAGQVSITRDTTALAAGDREILSAMRQIADDNIARHGEVLRILAELQRLIDEMRRLFDRKQKRRRRAA